ncbi:MAG: hypothetical protein WCS31_18135 [Verrucomicrobiae bacterium]
MPMPLILTARGDPPVRAMLSISNGGIRFSSLHHFSERLDVCRINPQRCAREHRPIANIALESRPG